MYSMYSMYTSCIHALTLLAQSVGILSRSKFQAVTQAAMISPLEQPAAQSGIDASEIRVFMVQCQATIRLHPDSDRTDLLLVS